MRDYRFRVYNPADETMMYNVGLDRISEYADETLVKMLQTGLKDRNGTNIYEGDIVKCTDDSDEVNELNSDTCIGKVKWTAFGFWEVDELNNCLGDLSANGYVEVIGNIYDTPELLKQE